MKLTKTAEVVLKKRYLKKDNNGNPEKVEDLFKRVAKDIALNEKDKTIQEKFYNLMINRDFMPNSPTLMNAGRDLQQLSACFVLPIYDSMESIFEGVKNAALIHKSGGGTGFSFSNLRMKGDRVKSTGGVASGPVSFMKVYNAATQAVKQGGTRRGANMGILNIHHPDIEEFIDSKLKENELNNFNISVAITDDFMEKLQNDKDFKLINPKDKKVIKKLKAKDLFDKIVKNAHASGEPGIIFIDKINKFHPLNEKIESTNPCGEQPLLPYESCNLGSINLSNMVENGKINWQKLKEVVYTSVRFLDNVIDRNKYPLKEIDKKTKENRKIGLGVMGFADLLIKLKVAYDSDKAIEIADNIMFAINYWSKEASIYLAKERGKFPNFDNSIYAEGKIFLNEPDKKYNELKELTYENLINLLKKYGIRNATTTTIAPTGTISIIAGTSGGIEPNFALSYQRTILDNDTFFEVNPELERYFKENNVSKDVQDKIIKQGNLHNIKEIPDEVKNYFKVSYDISPVWHVKMQAIFQKHTDNAVSKTVNLPSHATTKDVYDTYIYAYKLGCKGVTVYRDQSRSEQVLSTPKKDKITTQKKELTYRPRPQVTTGKTIRVKTGCGYLYVTINEDEYGLAEVFAIMGKSGGCASAQSEAIGRLISLALRAGVDAKLIVKHLRGIQCSATAWDVGGMVLSCPDAIGIALEKYLKFKETGKIAKLIPKDSIKNEKKHGICPECGSPVIYESGCMVCPVCGYSKCS